MEWVESTTLNFPADNDVQFQNLFLSFLFLAFSHVFSCSFSVFCNGLLDWWLGEKSPKKRNRLSWRFLEWLPFVWKKDEHFENAASWDDSVLVVQPRGIFTKRSYAVLGRFPGTVNHHLVYQLSSRQAGSLVNIGGVPPLGLFFLAHGNSVLDQTVLMRMEGAKLQWYPPWN